MSQDRNDQTAIEQLVGKYVDGINKSNADVLSLLFARDGVVMTPDAPTAAGTEQIKAFFEYGFQTVQIVAKIYIDEIVVAGAYAFSRTHSDVKIKVLQNNTSQDEANRELFLLTKDSGEWKISRYMFNKMPLAQ